MFVAWMHPAVLDPRNVGWLLDGSDRGQNSMGLIAYLRAGGPWPGLHDPLLMAPDGLPLALTDSNPLLGLLLKPFGLPSAGKSLGCGCSPASLLQVDVRPRAGARYVADPLAAFLGTALLGDQPGADRALRPRQSVRAMADPVGAMGVRRSRPRAAAAAGGRRCSASRCWSTPICW